MAKKILIIDDDPVVVNMLSKRLQANGYSTLEAFDGVQGLEMAHRELPDLITLDILMPELNGYSVCAFLRSDKDLKKIPIIIITSCCGDNVQEFDEPYAPDAFIAKPCQVAEVLEEISHLLN